MGALALQPAEKYCIMLTRCANVLPGCLCAAVWPGCLQAGLQKWVGCVILEVNEQDVCFGQSIEQVAGSSEGVELVIAQPDTFTSYMQQLRADDASDGAAVCCALCAVFARC